MSFKTYLSQKEANVLNNMNQATQNNRLGDALRAALMANAFTNGNKYYLDPANGSDDNDGLSPDTAFLTLPYAYSKLTANQNDILFYIAGSSSISLTAAFTWAKSYTHFFGVCAPVGAAKRARIFQNASTSGLASLITISATGCIWADIYIFHGVADATSKICCTITGGRNYFENMHFAGIGDTTMDVAGASSLKLNGAEENRFVGCQIGLDTIARGANSTELWLDGAANRNEFIDCLIYSYISNAGHANVTLEDGTAIDRFLIFKDCIFMTDSENQAYTQTQMFNLKAAIVQGKIILKDCMLITDGASGSGVWDNNTRGIIFNNTSAPAAAAVGGIATKQ